MTRSYFQSQGRSTGQPLAEPVALAYLFDMKVLAFVGVLR